MFVTIIGIKSKYLISLNPTAYFLYQFDKCLLQMVGTLHATSVRKKEEGRRKKE
ncbi:MAG: hypothetical protein F6K48_26050 [Okeania sp. SIO3H1]|uniref:hypothetical protein n=1 Tax=Okeania sp. SIO1I7 TaxID=2607772 RepID=UPI0013CBA7A6|nr:hypothetical protein [Okeania sp. SIO1I7]NEN92178.1 hypothetical protein [Okeania sp. SIO3H1]NET26841.1 hypothetical protein [Okeania sp. SIO1I7]